MYTAFQDVLQLINATATIIAVFLMQRKTIDAINTAFQVKLTVLKGTPMSLNF